MPLHLRPSESSQGTPDSDVSVDGCIPRWIISSQCPVQGGCSYHKLPVLKLLHRKKKRCFGDNNFVVYKSKFCAR